MNIKLLIEYDGKNYLGWQKQKSTNHLNSGKSTIQQTIENALHVLFPVTSIKLIGSGRTDTGVHAFNQVANFKIENDLFSKYGSSSLLKSLNAILPADISIKKISRVNDDFHARYSAKKRVYLYFISLNKSALFADRVYYLKTKFDIDLARNYCKLLIGEHSFRQFCKNKNDKHNFRSIVYFANVMKQKDGLIRFEICANRFLHSMVRAIVGMMIKMSSNKISIEEFKNKFYKGEQIKIQYVPSHALFLKKIIY